MKYYAGENLDRFDFRITKINRAELEVDRPKREKDMHRNIGSYQKIDVFDPTSCVYVSSLLRVGNRCLLNGMRLICNTKRLFLTHKTIQQRRITENASK